MQPEAVNEDDRGLAHRRAFLMRMEFLPAM
jgi:hypothetical protein